MQFTIEYLEYILLVFIRIASMMVTAPFFNSGNFPRMTKMGLSSRRSHPIYSASFFSHYLLFLICIIS